MFLIIIHLIIRMFSLRIFVVLNLRKKKCHFCGIDMNFLESQHFISKILVQELMLDE